MNNIPEVGKFYHFWDDGKRSVSRHYIAKVEKIIPFEEAKNIFTYFYDEVKSLVERWKDEVEDYEWLYNKETDFFIECSIPLYDKDPIYFVRDKENGWFSINTTSWWQSGRLDVDGSIYKEVLESSSEDVKDLYKALQYENI